MAKPVLRPHPSPSCDAALTKFRLSGSRCLNTFQAGMHHCHPTKTVLVKPKTFVFPIQGSALRALPNPAALDTLMAPWNTFFLWLLGHPPLLVLLLPRWPLLTFAHSCSPQPYCWLRSQPFHLSISTPTHVAISSSPRPVLLSACG